MSHMPEKELVRLIKIANRKVNVGSEYKHYKNPARTYRVTGLAIIEDNNEIAVVYQAQYGAHLSFIRPLSVWLEKVEWRDKTVERFTKYSSTSKS